MRYWFGSLVWRLTRRWRCHCRSYNLRTGRHAFDCPRYRPPT